MLENDAGGLHLVIAVIIGGLLGLRATSYIIVIAEAEVKVMHGYNYLFTQPLILGDNPPPPIQGTGAVSSP